MREPLKDRTRLEHIQDAIDRILKFAEGKTTEQLASDSMSFYGIVKNIEIIGEAAYHLSKAFRNQHPETEWNDITRMRNVLVHDYYQIKPHEIWKAVNEDLKPLREQVSRYLTETDWDEWEKNQVVIAETAVHKNLVQTAKRMKKDGMDAKQISRYTGLPIDEIEAL